MENIEGGAAYIVSVAALALCTNAPLGGVWGHAPPENFEKKRMHFLQSRLFIVVF